ncbi:hypothetical protein OG819_55290 [Streptomyces sp. NBC_01549]|uniref:hypothetical protein n=1 Tax=Streptomyces sp. NBC_01549 TaxID=2975874 RepID=UPI00224F84A0|nr:hypothetical protein [Streptomyces sp. NBC_01549]MCX4598324.1 hypothetical protein [Streptomyces sp. NBC_01549]
MTTVPAPAEIRYCQHAARVVRVEAPVVTEMVAAMAHLDQALEADPHDSTAYYAPRGQEHLVGDWIIANAKRIRAQLDALVTRYTDPGSGLISQVTEGLSKWSDPVSGRTFDLDADYVPAGDIRRHPGIVWRYRGMHAASGAPILHPHQLPDRTQCAGPCWPLNAVPTLPALEALEADGDPKTA